MKQPPQHRYQSAEEVVVAATRWLLARYAERPGARLASLIRQHLDWLAARPELTGAAASLRALWRTLETSPLPRPLR